jgi:hypothetical protein
MSTNLYLKLVYFNGDLTLIHSTSEAAAERLWLKIDACTHEVREASIIKLTSNTYELVRTLA